MKIFLRFLLLIMVCGRLEAGELYAFLVADTEGDNIGEAVALDLRNMEEEVGRIAWYTGLNLVEKIYTGEVLDPEFLKAEIDDLSFSEDDVVIFYFSGHGFRTAGNGDLPWPNLYLSLVDKGVEFHLLSMMLAEKKPGLLLSMCDCCNSWITEEYAPPVTRKSLPMEEVVERNYRKLFLETRGVLMGCSSEPGEYSWCTSWGSFYTVAFLEMLKNEMRSKSGASWKSIFKKTSRNVSRYQSPVYQIETKKAPN